MANRAYLYSSNNPEIYAPENWEYPHETDFFDSRHNIPFAWFFLFHPSDLNLIEMGGWQEVKVFAGRETALATFARRRPLLREIIGPEFHSEEIVQFFIERMSRWEGNYLLMDPGEIVQGDDEEVVLRWSDTFRLLDTPGISPSEVLQAFSHHACFRSPDTTSLQVNLTGYCYGDIEKR